MGSEALLQRACELAFAVAREDAEANPSVDPPGDMRSFLYLARLPRRAIAVAQQAIEDDSEFRSRVAARASEDEVGRAGYLWLHRPIGWAPEFEELAQRAESEAAEDAQDPPLVDVTTGADAWDFDSDQGNGAGDADEERDTPDVVSAFASSDFDPADTGTENGNLEDTMESSVRAAADVDPEADAIESELTSLRGLVDRLAGERELVMSNSSGDPENNADMSVLEDELAAVNSELDFNRDELARINTDLASVRAEREEARRQQSEALKRQVEVERELAEVREERAEVETRASELQVQLISVEDRLKRLQSDLEESERERNVVHSQLETMTAERNQIREDRMAIKAERDTLQTRLAEVDEKTGGVDVGELTAANRSLTQELEATSRELARMIAQVESYDEQLKTTTATADSLKSEKVELTSRLADTELALETIQTQYGALKDDAERLAAEVGTLRAERDGLQSQLTELQASLSDVLDEHAEARHRNDADRKALNELRVERDVLLARMNDIEAADRSYENRINALTKERDGLLTARDELMGERGELRGEVAAAASARDQLLEKIDTLESKLGPLEIELQAERRQREELATRLLELDDIAAANQASLEELSAERDRLAQERADVSQKLEVLEAERVDIEKLTSERDELSNRLEQTETQRDEESERRSKAVAELNEQIATLESDKSHLETQISENQSELARVRSDVDELNRENAKLRFNLQVAESSAAEAAEAAEEARQSAAEATAKVVEAESRVERAEVELANASQKAVEAESRAERAEVELANASQMAVSALAAPAEVAEAPVEAEAPVPEEEPAVEEALAEELDERELGSLDEVVAEPEVVEDVSQQADQTVPGIAAEVAEDRDVDGADADDWIVDTPVEEEVVEQVEAIDEVVGAPEPILEPIEAEAGTGSILETDEADLAAGVPSLLSPEPSTESGEVPVLDDMVAADEAQPGELLDGGLPAEEPVGTAPETLTGFTPVSDVVDMDQRRRDDTTPFVNDWKPVASREEPDELDEISELISRTVSNFDSPVDDVAPEPPAFAESAGFMDDMSAPPSVFGAETGAENVQGFDDAYGEGAGQHAGTSRRQIEIPTDIMDDEIAVAQHVVSSPDVVLLVDGDSVAKLGWPSLPVAQQRDALVTYLADLSASSGAAPDVVFDGRVGDDDSLPVSRAVRIRLSTPPTEPAAALDELVSAYPDQWPIALVTDDPTLAASARERGAVVLNNGQLLDLFIAQ